VYWDSLGDCWCAESLSCLSGWVVLYSEQFKSSVLRLHVYRTRPCAEYRIVYVRGETPCLN
jgi:hypothetical protein